MDRDGKLEERRRLSPWQGRLLALVLGICLVLGIEAGLHLLPGFAPPPFVLEIAAGQEQRLYNLNPAYPRNFFAGRIGEWSLEGIALTPHPFLEPRPERAVRVLFAGASTVQGYPHPRRLAAASYMQTMLRRVWPNRPVEVINAGITSVASFAVARTVEDAMELRPDLVVVYTGHNEFYGVYGATALREGGSSVRAKRLYYGILRWRLAALARYLAGWIVSPQTPDISLLEALSRAGGVGPDDPRREVARRNLRDNLTHIVRFCRWRGIPVVLCTLVSNEAGFAPDSSTAFVPLSPEKKARWRDLVSRAGALLQEAGEGDGNAAKRAMIYLDEAAAEFDRHALLQYFRGQALDRVGDESGARQAFSLARDLDTVPLRALGTFNPVVRQVAQSEGALLADVETVFIREAPARGPGWDLLSDHVHPSATGQVLLARAIVRALRHAPEPVRLDESQVEGLPGAAELGDLHGDLPVERLAVAQAMIGLLSQPPLNSQNQGRVAHLRNAVTGLWAELSPAEQQGYRKWEKLAEKVPLALCVADELFTVQDFDRARFHYQAARLEIPYTVGELWASLRWGRCLLFEQGHLEEEQVLEIQAAIQRAYLLASTPSMDSDFMDFFLDYAGRLVKAGRKL